MASFCRLKTCSRKMIAKSNSARNITVAILETSKVDEQDVFKNTLLFVVYQKGIALNRTVESRRKSGSSLLIYFYISLQPCMRIDSKTETKHYQQKPCLMLACGVLVLPTKPLLHVNLAFAANMGVETFRNGRTEDPLAQSMCLASCGTRSARYRTVHLTNRRSFRYRACGSPQ